MSLLDSAVIEESKATDLPGYKDPGRILFEIVHIYRGSRPNWCGLYEIDVLDHDGDSSVMWLQEGQGIEYWLNAGPLDLEETGFYVLEGVTGTYYPGDGWMTDNDEEWDFELCRRATAEEIETGSLS